MTQETEIAVKHCRFCNKTRPQDEWYPSVYVEKGGRCRSCTAKYQRDLNDRKRNGKHVTGPKRGTAVVPSPPVIDIHTLLGSPDPRVGLLADVLKRRDEFDRYVVSTLTGKK